MILLFLSTIILYSCSPVSSVLSMVGNAGTSSKGLGSSFDDGVLKTKIVSRISMQDLEFITNVKIMTSKGRVLITGFVYSQEDRYELIRSIWRVKGVKEIYNEVKVLETMSFVDRTEDLVFKSKIKSRLLFKPGINSYNYQIDVVKGDVFVIGIAENIEEKSKVENFLKTMTDIKRLVTVISLSGVSKSD